MLRIAIASRPEPIDQKWSDWPELSGSLPVAILLLDPDGRVARANARAEQLLNLSERAAAGRPLANLLRSPLIEAVACGDDLAVYDAQVATDGGVLRLDIAVALVADHSDRRVVTLHAAEPRHTSDRGEAGRVAVGAAAMLAHEIKNPLSGIRGAAQLLGPGELSTLIVTEVDRIAALIDRMQLFTDTRPLPLSAGSIYPVLTHARRVALAGFSRGINIDESYDPSLPAALINDDALVQVLLNLLKNAVEASGDKREPRVSITTAYRHGTTRRIDQDRQLPLLPIEVCVRDDGPGPPSDIADQLFDPFVSGHPDGTGLGLALVDKLVRDMGGLVRHTREGNETVFRVLLARAPA
ncbi:nitrogen regulation protein NR(II) [uncultured Sphingomonas sp.]|uniref:two-component system sensor histidine kinase NtrB n=1 Tax=uncultured Sphingomonas sp. TaxID=158754 RepID=UPI0035CC1462